MATRNIVPRANGEGSIGTAIKHWGAGYFNDIIAKGPVVDVRSFGAKGDGVTDDTAAIQAATQTEKTVYFPQGTYVMSAPVTYQGTVKWVGEYEKTVIKSDRTVISISDGDGSVIKNIKFVNITTPYTIKRNTSDWSYTLSVSNDGYQPTVNDTDVYNSLTGEQKNQNIGPVIEINDSNNCEISGVTGRFVRIELTNCSYYDIHDNNIHGGKGTFGAIVTKINSNDKKNIYGKIHNNTVDSASYNGIVLCGAQNCIVDSNIVTNNGESGVKTYQNTIDNVDFRCSYITVSNNISRGNFYDGLDISCDYPHTGNYAAYNSITNNLATNNHETGFYLDGMYITVTSNVCVKNGSGGLLANANKGLVNDNRAVSNNQRLLNDFHGISVIGSNNTVSNNYASDTLHGYDIYISGDNKTYNNYPSQYDLSSNFEQNFDGSVSINTPNATNDVTALNFYPRRTMLKNPSAVIKGVCVYGAPNAERGRLGLYSVYDGVPVKCVEIQETGAITNKLVETNLLEKGEMNPYYDSTNNRIVLKIKDSNGNVKRGYVTVS